MIHHTPPHWLCQLLHETLFCQTLLVPKIYLQFLCIILIASQLFVVTVKQSS